MSAELTQPPSQSELPASQLAPAKGLISGNVYVHGHRTSVRLEAEMWAALNEVAGMEGCTIHDLCSAVDDSKAAEESFTGALRVFLLKYYRDAARGKVNGTPEPQNDKAQALGFRGMC